MPASALIFDQPCTAMTTHIQEGMRLSISVAGQQNGLACQLRPQKRTGFGELRTMAGNLRQGAENMMFL